MFLLHFPSARAARGLPGALLYGARTFLPGFPRPPSGRLVYILTGLAKRVAHGIELPTVGATYRLWNSFDQKNSRITIESLDENDDRA